MHCCVPGCVSDDRKQDPCIHFHSFPKDKSLKKQWIVKIKRDEGPLFHVSTIAFISLKNTNTGTENTQYNIDIIFTTSKFTYFIYLYMYL